MIDKTLIDLSDDPEKYGEVAAAWEVAYYRATGDDEGPFPAGVLKFPLVAMNIMYHSSPNAEVRAIVAPYARSAGGYPWDADLNDRFVRSYGKALLGDGPVVSE